VLSQLLARLGERARYDREQQHEVCSARPVQVPCARRLGGQASGAAARLDCSLVLQGTGGLSGLPGCASPQHAQHDPEYGSRSRCRYFTVPAVLAALHARPASRPELLWTAAAFAVVNAATIALFLFRPFRWPDGSIARFMW